MLLYKDLLTEIEILEIQKRGVEREYQNIYNKSLMVKPKGVRAVDYGAERVTGGLVQIPFYDAIGKVEQVKEKYREIEQELALKYRLRDEIKEHIEQLEGIEYQVARKKWIENKSLAVIAKELSFSEIHIKKISAKLEKKRTAVEC